MSTSSSASLLRPSYTSMLSFFIASFALRSLLLLIICGPNSLTTIFFLRSVKLESVSTHCTLLPKASSSILFGLGGNRLIFPWKCVLESWLRDHCFKCFKNVLRWCACACAQSRFAGFRGDVVDGRRKFLSDDVAGTGGGVNGVIA